MADEEPFQIAYRTLTERERTGPYGALMRRIAAHPMVAGALGGLCAIGVALWRGHVGAMSAPWIAAAICAVVLVAWVILFRVMRDFFDQQTRQRVEVVRQLRVDDDELVWLQSGRVHTQIPSPTWRVGRAPGQLEQGADDQTPWPIWLTAQGERASFVIESRLMWREARQLPEEDPAPDERLPVHVLSPLLRPHLP